MQKYLIIALLFTQLEASVNFLQAPCETAVIEFSDKSETNWKEISHSVSNHSSTCEVIPLHQTMDHWTDLICIQQINRSEVNHQISCVEDLVNTVKKTLFETNTPNTLTWNLLEKTEHDILYEWIVLDPLKKIPFEHEISRAIQTDKAFHRIAYTKKYDPLSPEERSKRIDLLKNNTRILPFQNSSNGLSLASKIKSSIKLSPDFSDFSLSACNDFDNGAVCISYNPPSKHKNPQESLEVYALHNLKQETIDEIFEREIDTKKSIYKGIKIALNSKSPSEITYSGHYNLGYKTINLVNRVVLTPHAYYSFSYIRSLKLPMPKCEIKQLDAKLKTIQVEWMAEHQQSAR